MLRLHFHPLSSFCWKALIALYEADIAFEPVMVNFGDPASFAAFKALWPPAKMPVLEDTDAGLVLPEATIIVEHLARTHPSAASLIPSDPAAALQVRLADRLYDLHVQLSMQKITGDRLRPQADRDPFGVAEARERLRVVYGVVEAQLSETGWAVGRTFTMADCAALPALFYADKVSPLREAHPKTHAYLDRLKARPSIRRVLAEAEPYFHMFPA